MHREFAPASPHNPSPEKSACGDRSHARSREGPVFRDDPDEVRRDLAQADAAIAETRRTRGARRRLQHAQGLQELDAQLVGGGLGGLAGRQARAAPCGGRRQVGDEAVVQPDQTTVRGDRSHEVGLQHVDAAELLTQVQVSDAGS